MDPAHDLPDLLDYLRDVIMEVTSFAHENSNILDSTLPFNDVIIVSQSVSQIVTPQRPICTDCSDN